MTMTSMQYIPVRMKNQKKENHKKNGNQGRKNMKVFYKINVKDSVDLTNTPHEEEYTDENYESVEE